ncbi:MAG: peptidoglycan DD-metalloendopeptidase family protein [Bacteroidetes bacterium]|nr:peptidoglycan DD-metalloendopeptidase family protein [Bacteroidota bacterium]
MLKKISFCLVLSFVAHVSFAQNQTKSDLEKERAEIQKQIEDVKRSLDETKKNRKETLGQLSLLQRKLRLRQAAIQNINQQINLIQGDMNQSWRDILKLRGELDTLKKQYEESVVYAYKNRSNYDFLNFIFSATSFNDALKRVEYLKSYRAYRQERAENIVKTQSLLQGKINGLKVKREEKDQVLQKQNKERSVLEDEKKEKDQFISKLKSREKELQKDLAAKQRQNDKLQAAVRAAIARELKVAKDKALAEEKKRAAENTPKTNPVKVNPVNTNPVNANPVAKTDAPPKPKSVFEATPEGFVVSENFKKNKGNLRWPVETGHVTTPFGMSSVEGMDKIRQNSPGVTIATPINSAVHAVFEGEVSSVFNIEGSSAVIIHHGEYFTTYSNLSSASVVKGEKVSVGQIIGKAGENEDGAGEIMFMISSEKGNLNPEQWLKRR